MKTATDEEVMCNGQRARNVSANVEKAANWKRGAVLAQVAHSFSANVAPTAQLKQL